MISVTNDRVSTRLIRRILQRDIAKRIRKMSDAITGDTGVFTGVQPFTAIAIAALVLAFVEAEAAYSVGGSLKRKAFLDSKTALYDCMLQFASYVDGVAKGNAVTLALSTLPLLSDEIDFAALIAAGGIAANITAKQGKPIRQIITNCDSFGLGVGYIVIVSEGMPLPAGFALTSDGTFTSLTGMRCTVNSFGVRKKTINDLLPKTEYFVYYVLTYGRTVGLVSGGVSVVTSA